jgi:hypothetical protein
MPDNLDAALAFAAANGYPAARAEVEWLRKERDELRADVERLRRALSYIEWRGYTGACYVAWRALRGEDDAEWKTLAADALKAHEPREDAP